MFGKSLSRQALGLVLCVAAAACGGHSTSDLVPTPDPAPVVTSPRVELRAELAAHRQQQIARLHEYALAGMFPVNTTVGPFGHFFRDSAGRLCAVATLVPQDGRDDLVAEVGRTRSDLGGADVHDGSVYDWMLSSGLTQEELAASQAPAPLVRPTRPTTPT